MGSQSPWLGGPGTPRAVPTCLPSTFLYIPVHPCTFTQLCTACVTVQCMQMPIWDHLEELRERVLVGALAAAVAVLTCFAFSKDLVVFLEAPVASQGVRFLQLSPGEFFFTTLKVSSAPRLP